MTVDVELDHLAGLFGFDPLRLAVPWATASAVVVTPQVIGITVIVCVPSCEQP